MRLHHLGWVVKDLARSELQFAREGAEAISPAIPDPTQRVVVQFLRDAESDVLWELIAPLGDVEGSPLKSRLARGGGLDHACYELEPADGTLEAVVAAEVVKGARVLCAPVHAVAFDRRIAFVWRPSGRVVEFVEPRRDGMRF